MKNKKLEIEGLKRPYIIYENGQIFDIMNNRFKKLTENKKGYLKVSFYINGKSKKFFVHRLVLSAFNPIENMDELQVDHIDCNKKNNNLNNLEWVTNAENQRRAFNNNLIVRKGTKNSQNKFSEGIIIGIANMLMRGYTYSEIMYKYKVSKSLISAIRNKRLWTELLQSYNFPKSKYSNQK